ncbi:MAG: hypothetical protein ABIU29_01455 [Chthoniobacterales bacterium]
MLSTSKVSLIAGTWMGYLASGHADTFTVTTIDPRGSGSLTEAIETANVHAGADTIAFNFPGSGVHTIAVGDTSLPEVTDPVMIDGYTQPGASPNTLDVGDDAVILIRIDGSSDPQSPAVFNLLTVSAGNTLIRGLAFTGFPPLEFPSLSRAAIVLFAGGNNVVQGNFVGLSSDDLPVIRNSIGIAISSSNNTVGGTLAAERNIITFNDLGMEIDFEADSNLIEGNYFGADPSGTSAPGNKFAISVAGAFNQIGGVELGAGNLISGNETGIEFLLNSTMNFVEGNFIGTDAAGAADLGNSIAGLLVAGSNNTIGGLHEGMGNRIWFNARGVVVRPGDSVHQSMGNAILSNSISAPVKIDLTASGVFDGPTRNDIGDADTGSNELQNFPVLSSISFLADRTAVQGGLSSTPSTTFTIQFFTEGLRANESGFIETKSVTTNSAGLAYFEFDLKPLPFDLTIKATATDPAGNTSEFQDDFAVQLANISARGQVGAGENILIGGFIVRPSPDGDTTDFSKRVLLRALGPSLGVDGVPLAGRLENPTLELFDESGTIIGANDNWRETQETEITATGLAPTSDAEAALIADLPAGSYTVQVRGVGDATGLGIIEAYDLDPPDPIGAPRSGRLINLSARGLVGTGDDVLIGGLIVQGDAEEEVLIRAIGPDLAAEQVVNPLADPTLELRDASGSLMATNENWPDSQITEINATGLAPGDLLDAAILVSLLPGNYTAIVRGHGETSGVALVEIYDLNTDN